MPLPSPVPAVAPTDVEVSRSTENPRIITVTWRPFTLVEARGFIEYLVQLHEVSSAKRQDGLTQRVPMDQGSTTFTVDDTSINYEASVGTASLSGDTVGPGQHSEIAIATHDMYTFIVSQRVSIPLTSSPTDATAAPSSLTTIIIAVCISVVVILIVAMVLATITIIVALRNRHSTIDLTKESR